MTRRKKRKIRDKIQTSSEKFTTTKKLNIMKGGTTPDIQLSKELLEQLSKELLEADKRLLEARNELAQTSQAAIDAANEWRALLGANPAAAGTALASAQANVDTKEAEFKRVNTNVTNMAAAVSELVERLGPDVAEEVRKAANEKKETKDLDLSTPVGRGTQEKKSISPDEVTIDFAPLSSYDEEVINFLREHNLTPKKLSLEKKPLSSDIEENSGMIANPQPGGSIADAGLKTGDFILSYATDGNKTHTFISYKLMQHKLKNRTLSSITYIAGSDIKESKTTNKEEVIRFLTKINKGKLKSIELKDTPSYFPIAAIGKRLARRSGRDAYKAYLDEILTDIAEKSRKHKELLFHKIKFGKNKQLIRAILISKVSYILMQGQSRFDWKKQVKRDESYGENEDDEEAAATGEAAAGEATTPKALARVAAGKTGALGAAAAALGTGALGIAAAKAPGGAVEEPDEPTPEGPKPTPDEPGAAVAAGAAAVAAGAAGAAGAAEEEAAEEDPGGAAPAAGLPPGATPATPAPAQGGAGAGALGAAQQDGGLLIGFSRDVSKEDTRSLCIFLLDGLTEIAKLSKDKEDKKTIDVLQAKFFQVFFKKVDSSQLNVLLGHIDISKKILQNVVGYFSEKLTDDTKDGSTDTSEYVANISKLKFGLKHNMNSLVTTIVDITLNIGELQQFEGNRDGMANHLDMNYSRAMNIPFGDDKKRISNLELSQALREIFDGELSKLVEYKEKIKKVDDLIDTIDSDNIRTKIEQIIGIIKVASFTDTEINYKLPTTLSSILEDTKKDISESSPTEELTNMRKLIAEFLNVPDEAKAKKEELRTQLQDAAAATTPVAQAIPVAQVIPIPIPVAPATPVVPPL